MKKTILAILLLSVFLLAACAKNGSAPTTQTPETTLAETDPTEITPTEAAPAETETALAETQPSASVQDPAAPSFAGVSALDDLRIRIKEKDCVAAAAYIHTGVYENYQEVLQLLEDRGYTETYDFVKDLRRSQVIFAGGGSVYLIVPADDECTIAVNRWTSAAGTGEVLYRSETGDPVVVACNDYGMVDLEVNMVYEGRTCTFYPAFDNVTGAPLLPNDGSLIDTTLPRGAGIPESFTGPDGEEQAVNTDEAFRHLMEYPAFGQKVNDGSAWLFTGIEQIDGKTCYKFDIGHPMEYDFYTEYYYAISADYETAYELSFMTGSWVALSK